MLSYEKKLGNHHFKAMFVFVTEESTIEGLNGYAKDFGSDYYTWTSLGLGNVDYHDVGSSEQKTFLESLIGRLNYSFQGRYLASFTIRHDCSSKFAKENRNAIFPGGSVGWRISQEPFMQNVLFLDNLKLRLSYAHTGNQGIGYRSIYNVGTISYYTTGQDGSGNIVEGLSQTSMPNKDLSWEKSSQSNIGLDFSVFNNKLSGVVVMFHFCSTMFMVQ